MKRRLVSLSNRKMQIKIQWDIILYPVEMSWSKWKIITSVSEDVEYLVLGVPSWEWMYKSTHKHTQMFIAELLIIT